MKPSDPFQNSSSDAARTLGKITTPKKAKASKANGELGGRRKAGLAAATKKDRRKTKTDLRNG